MSRPPTVVIVILVWIVGGTVIGVLFVVPAYVDSILPLRVTGRLVHAEDGRPVPNAWILTLRDRGWAMDDARLDEASRSARRWIAWQRDERLVPPGPRAAPADMGGSPTDEQGTFDAYLLMRWGCFRHGILGGERPTPQMGVRALRIEIEGRDPVILDVPEGTWTEHDGEDDLWATWDLGVVEVPSTP